MIEVRLGDRYAKSILDLAIERGALDAVREDFKRIEAVSNANPDFVRMLKSPLITPDKKHKVLDSIFGKDAHEITKVFLKIIVNKKREGYLRDIAMRFLHQYDRHKNITRGVLVSAAPLTPAQRDAITALVARELHTTFELTEQVDPNMIGGFTLRVGDKLFDASIATRLRELKQEFSKNPYVKQV